MSYTDILAFAEQVGASDVVLHVGHPVVFRVGGQLLTQQQGWTHDDHLTLLQLCDIPVNSMRDVAVYLDAGRWRGLISGMQDMSAMTATFRLLPSQGIDPSTIEFVGTHDGSKTGAPLAWLMGSEPVESEPALEEIVTWIKQLVDDPDENTPEP